MRKTFVYRLLTLVVMIGLVAGIGQTAAPQAAAQDKVKLVVVGDGGANQIAWFWNQQEMQDEFGVTLEIIGFSFEDLYTKLKTEFVAGTGAFDIVVYYPKHLGDFVANGYLIPLTPYINGGPGADMEDIVPAFRDLNGKIGNDYYGLPYDGDVLALFYRTDLFSNVEEMAAFQAKYGYPLAPPETWDQYLHVAEFFTRKAGDKLAGETLAKDFYGTATYGSKDFQYAWYLNYAASMGVTYFDETMKPGINQHVRSREGAGDVQEGVPVWSAGGHHLRLRPAAGHFPAGQHGYGNSMDRPRPCRPESRHIQHRRQDRHRARAGD